MTAQRIVLSPEQDLERLEELYEDFGNLRDQIHAECLGGLRDRWVCMKSEYTSELKKIFMWTVGGVALAVYSFDGFAAGVFATISVIWGGFVLHWTHEPNFWSINYTLSPELNEKWEELQKRRLDRGCDRNRWAYKNDLCDWDADVVIEHDEYIENGSDFLAPWIEDWFK